jgi:DNA-binding MarR family transcriptional regulator
VNAIFFGLKRAWHGTLRIGRTTLRTLGLTAARFDLLYALTYEGRTRAPAMRQSALRRVLGVSRPTVSRMLRSLEELGLIERRRSEVDRRQLDVQLTSKGWFRIRFAYRIVARSGWAQLALDCALGVDEKGEDRWHHEVHCLHAMNDVDETLMKIRRTFGDAATLDYPWLLYEPPWAEQDAPSAPSSSAPA